jgi:1-acyl-sn-glycerol-3-phosphate acyltransferase
MSREFDEIEIVNKIPLKRFIKEVMARLFALYALLLFVPSLIVTALVFSYLRIKYQEPELSVRTHKWFRRWMRLFTNCIFSPVKTRGEENFAPGENYIVVCNHRSLMDVPVSTPFIPGPNKTIAKKEMSKIPLFGIVYKTGSVLVDRKSEKSRRQSYEDMKKVLDMGLHMCIYPEGTRNRSHMPLKRFHDGAFKLAIETGKKIIPTAIYNTSKVLPPDKFFYLWPYKMKMQFCEPVDPTGLTVEELKQKVFNIMLEQLRRRRKKKMVEPSEIRE